MRSVKHVPLPERWPLIAYFPAQLIFTLTTQLCLLLGYRSDSWQYEWTYTAGVLIVLIVSFATGAVASGARPLALVMLLFPLSLGGWNHEQITRIWYLGAPFTVHLLNAHVLILSASAILAAFSRLRVFKILAVYWLCLAAFDQGLLFDSLSRGAPTFQPWAAYFHALATVVAFSAIGAFVRKTNGKI